MEKPWRRLAHLAYVRSLIVRIGCTVIRKAEKIIYGEAALELF
jgi:hypothetical protein